MAGITAIFSVSNIAGVKAKIDKNHCRYVLIELNYSSIWSIMKSILLPTDFSANSVNAIHYAIQLFRDFRCEFYILNVQKVSSFVSDDLLTMQPSTTLYQNLIDSAKKNIEKIIAEIRAECRTENHLYHSIVDYDNFIDAINQTVRAKQIDYIVMGTQGATGAEKVLFGSNTVRVMQRCSCPVLAVPENCSYRALNKIVFTSNYHSQYKLDELKPLRDLAEYFNSKITVIHLTHGEPLSKNQQNNKAFLDDYFSDLKHEFVSIESDTLFETIENYLSVLNVDLLAMMSRRHSFLERLFTRHTVETFAFHVKTPFLVMENTGKLLQ